MPEADLFADSGRRVKGDLKSSFVRYVRVRLRRAMATILAALPSRHSGQVVHKAAILKVDRLGDFVLALSAIRITVNYFGGQNCVLIVAPQVRLLACREFPMATVIAVSASVGHKRLIAEARSVRRVLATFRCETVVCFRHQRWDWDELLLRWLAADRYFVLDDLKPVFGPDERCGYRAAIGGRIPFSEVIEPPDSSGNWISRELRMHFAVVSRIGAATIAEAGILPRFESYTEVPRPAGIFVSPFGSDRIRDMPLKLLRPALETARRYTAATIHLYGTADQGPRLEALASQLRAAGFGGIETVHNSDLEAYIDTIRNSEIIISVETATAHIAAAFDRPAVIIIGGGHFGQFGPWRRSRKQAWVTNSMDCFGCNWGCIYPEPFCITSVDRASVERAVVEVLTTKREKYE